MLWFSKKNTFKIGVDIGDETLKVAQLEIIDNGLRLSSGGSANRPLDIKHGSGMWQRWAIENLKNILSNGKFDGKEVVASIPAMDVFIEHIKSPKSNEAGSKKGGSSEDKIQEAIFAKIKQKLPFEPEKAMIRYIPTEEDNLMVIATEREKVDRERV
jgi:Tfp pilus assembly PilM family ATPase